MVGLNLDDDVDYAPCGITAGKNDFAPKEEKGDDDGYGSGGNSDHSTHSFDDGDKLEDDHVKSFEPLRVKVGLSWENVSIKT